MSFQTKKICKYEENDKINDILAKEIQGFLYNGCLDLNSKSKAKLQTKKSNSFLDFPDYFDGFNFIWCDFLFSIEKQTNGENYN